MDDDGGVAVLLRLAVLVSPGREGEEMEAAGVLADEVGEKAKNGFCFPCFLRFVGWFMSGDAILRMMLAVSSSLMGTSSGSSSAAARFSDEAGRAEPGVVEKVVVEGDCEWREAERGAVKRGIGDKSPGEGSMELPSQ